ncbi:hypothetical protein SAY86_004086 [Trapa natans]|uniref:Zinc finger PHD-type domain-containing protein n=1 Tax=Trapa natans TaxID=22666 RepID=A0AAN7MFA7_TRANT|nr:hypothetical protein SAY86_004086 [Trapa natans]
MSIPILQSCRKRKHRPRLFSFHTFGHLGCPIRPAAAFRDNIQLFLQECTMPEDYSLDGMTVGCTLLMHEKRSIVVPFYTIQENVEESSRSFCQHCRLIGWSNHFVSRKRYHMIIPIDGSWSKPLESDALDLSNHLLHGLVHGNGFGHLICINGIEGGSRYLRGREIMDLWDRICSVLCVRKLSVGDVSKKQSMDLRLLYGVAYGHSWFGRWGYRFLRGSFGVKEKNHQKAVELLSSLRLERIIEEFTGQSKEIKKIVQHYRDMSETTLITIRDLLRFMLTVKSRVNLQNKITAASPSPQPDVKPEDRIEHITKKAPMNAKPIRYRKFSSAMSDMDARWPTRRLEQAAEVIVSALLEKRADGSGHHGMTRQDVRDAARAHIGDTGLLDNVLKSMNNVIVGNYVVCRAVNPVTRILEYTVHELRSNKPTFPEQHEVTSAQQKIPPSTTLTAGDDVYHDLVYLYKNVLLRYPSKSAVAMAVQAVLDGKHFVKEWPFQDKEEQALTFVCNLLPDELLSENQRSSTIKKPPPGEIVSVLLHSTIGDLKLAAQSAFRDTYCIFQRLVVLEIESMEDLNDDEVLFGVIESGAEVWMRGTGADMNTKFKYEGGTQNWKVGCVCGAHDDDGERMVACDICEVWQHTRCCGIKDRDSVPPLFVCSGCCRSVMGSRGVDDEDDVLDFEQPCMAGAIEPFGSLLLPQELEYSTSMEIVPY